MITNISYKPLFVTPPGETLLDILNEKGMTQVELAQRIGRPLKTVNEIIKGKAAITPETSLQLEYALMLPASFWNNREAQYREYLATKNEADWLKKHLPILDQIPYAKMVKLGWMVGHKNPIDLLRELSAFFGVASPDKWGVLYDNTKIVYRCSVEDNVSFLPMAAWLRQGELSLLENDLPAYNKAKLADSLNLIKSIVNVKKPAVYLPKLQQCLSEAGILIAFVPELPGMKVCGATRWIKGVRPLIQLTFRYKTHDQLWFTLFHELAHLLLHERNSIFVDSVDNSSKDTREKEADAYARDSLIPPKLYSQFLETATISPVSIKRFAHSLNVLPGIVVGRLQHDKYITWSRFNDLKTYYSSKDIVLS